MTVTGFGSDDERFDRRSSAEAVSLGVLGGCGARGGLGDEIKE